MDPFVLTLGVYYALPFVRWTRGPGEPTQAVLVDLERHRFYFFFIEIWPQEVYYITGLMILAALGLFLMNALAGRIWCGYLCPQTVWTDLFLMIERPPKATAAIACARTPALDRRARRRKMIKHSLWLAIAWGPAAHGSCISTTRRRW